MNGGNSEEAALPAGWAGLIIAAVAFLLLAIAFPLLVVATSDILSATQYPHKLRRPIWGRSPCRKNVCFL